MMSSPDEIKMFNEARIQKKNPNEEEPKKRLTERIRERIYGGSAINDKSNNDKPKNN